MRPPVVHYGTGNGPACGARFQHDGLTNVGDAVGVTCARCRASRVFPGRREDGPDVPTPMDYARRGADSFTPAQARIIEAQNAARRAIAKAEGR